MLALGCVVMTPNTSFSAQQFTESVVMPTLQSPSGQDSEVVLSVSKATAVCVYRQSPVAGAESVAGWEDGGTAEPRDAGPVSI